MKTKPWALIIVVICTLFTALGSLFFKIAVDRFVFSLIGIVSNYFLILGLFFYFIGFLLLTWSFKHGEFSILFPAVSLSFVWVTVLSMLALSEAVNVFKVIGVLLIVSGVVVLGRAGNGSKIKMRG